MKIQSGIFKNLSIIIPTRAHVRPSLARTRAMVCNICQNDLEGAQFLDLFAGSGAVGFEALSRGAASVTFIDENKRSIEAILQTAHTLKAESQVKCLCKDVLDGLQALNTQQKQFTLIFMDPPYFQKGDDFQTLPNVLQLLDSSSLLAPQGRLFIEDSKISPIDTLTFTSLRLKSKRNCGDAHLWEFEKVG